MHSCASSERTSESYSDTTLVKADKSSEQILYRREWRRQTQGGGGDGGVGGLLGENYKGQVTDVTRRSSMGEHFW